VEKIVIKYFLKSSAFHINVCRTVAKFHAKGSVLEKTERRHRQVLMRKKNRQICCSIKASPPKYIYMCVCVEFQGE
jgi:hypothetical protein